MEPITAVVVIVAIAAGFGAGWGLKPDAGVKALEAQTEAIEALQKGNTDLVSEVQRVAAEEAKRETLVADKLTNVPPMCIKELGGDPNSALCAWAWCVRTGESDKQRCEAGKLTDLIIVQYRDKAP